MQFVWEWFRWLHDTTGINLTIFYDAFDRGRFASGFWMTVKLSVTCIVLSVLIGIAGAWVQRSRMTQRWRLANQGAIDRTRPLAFAYDGTRYEGYAGDTLASALLANGIHLVGRSFKYHRPRGIYSAGVEEPNALVQLARGAHTEPNARATTVELYDGLVAQSQNCWPSVRFDVGAVANALSPMLPAGFYYKTFMRWRSRMRSTAARRTASCSGISARPKAAPIRAATCRDSGCSHAFRTTSSPTKSRMRSSMASARFSPNRPIRTCWRFTRHSPT